ncbi:hypothetical protein [Ciceribacter sp. L1K22]|uniref:hypothetical protein n=1 Tax=Ciceribacter sp. L1K22 TaxID=2820275 RepID=UPI001ABE52A1|nr:hypothetical protein [Ciceribacter sp. L1K22]MBO3760032.1 hypothetical protein [Ciceribacter sp. L1K22]
MQNTDGWAPADYRRALDAWRETAPKHDSEIFAQPRKTNPRHAEKAARMRLLLMYRDPPLSEPVQSNWRTTPANDNQKPEDFFVERRLEVTPSLPEIERVFVPARDGEVPVVTFRHVREARLADGRFTHVEAGVISWPVAGDFEIREINGARFIHRLAGLCFSDGTHVEKAQRIAPGGGVEDFDWRLAAGAMRFTTEKETVVKRAAVAREHQIRANLRIASLFGIDELHEPPKGGRKKKKGARLSRSEARRLLAEAYAKPAPEVKKIPDGMPMATEDLGSIFMGIVKHPSGKPGATDWQDFATLSDFATAWDAVVKSLPEADVRVLECAMSAKSLAEIGRDAVGASDSFAERAGRLALEAANDNLSSRLRKIAA